MKSIPFLLLFSILLNGKSNGNNQQDSKPNILWIVSEDHGPHMGCYGDTYATTPNIDKFAEKGICCDDLCKKMPFQKVKKN